MPEKPTCVADACDISKRLTRSLCPRHYQRLLLYGDIEHARQTAEQRFWQHVLKHPSGCWEWTGSIIPANGYGRLQHGGKKNPIRSLAHRFGYELIVGPIPEGMTLDHLCHTRDLSCPGGAGCPHRRCVNPAHLEPVPSAVNTRRGRNSTKTRCSNGHDLTGPDVTVNARGHRICRACKRKTEAVRRSARRPPA